MAGQADQARRHGGESRGRLLVSHLGRHPKVLAKAEQRGLHVPIAGARLGQIERPDAPRARRRGGVWAFWITASNPLFLAEAMVRGPETTTARGHRAWPI